MSAQEQIARLQGLLARVTRNAQQPRAVGPTVTVSPTPLSPPVVSPPVVARAAPSEADLDVSVDDLLGGSPEPSPVPAEVDVTLESVPPAALGLGSPAEATLSLDSEVSEVRVAAVGSREPAVEVTVAAIAAEAEEIVLGTEELSDDDLVEIEDAEASAPKDDDVDIDFDDEVAEPPASSQRARVASSMDEALAAAAEQLDSEREAPLQTPPPESGPQAAAFQMPAGLAAPPAPRVDPLHGEELVIPTRAAGPTTEQLGQTVELEEARGPVLELVEQPAIADVVVPAATEELEMALPSRDVVGSYDDSLRPPPEALEDLAAHRRRLEEDSLPPPESLGQLPSARPGAMPELVVPAGADAAGPMIVARHAPAGVSAAAFVSMRQAFQPSTFVDLLDASLSLRGE